MSKVALCAIDSKALLSLHQSVPEKGFLDEQSHHPSFEVLVIGRDNHHHGLARATSMVIGGKIRRTKQMMAMMCIKNVEAARSP